MYRKGISALIINNKQEFLLLNLESFEEKYFTILGGGLEENETLEESCYREIKEEAGIEKESLVFINKSNNPLRFKFKVIKMFRDGKNYEGSERHFFAFRFTGDDSEIKLQAGEVRSYKWVKYADLKDYLLFENQLEDTQEKIRELFVNVTF
jgi:putative (di)nucleoside polyphosphate hydrolase